MARSTLRGENNQGWLTKNVRIIAVFVSCLFSAFVIIQDPLLNNDAFAYLKTAEVYQASGVRAAFEFYSWPIYSIAISQLNTTLNISLHYAAYLLNTILYVILVLNFIRLAETLSPTQHPQYSLSLIAAITILALPGLNEYRHYIIRDIGYLAFGLVALLQLIRYHLTTKWQHNLGWTIATFVAFAFRTEAIVFIVLAPLSVLVNSRIEHRFIAYLKLQLLPLGFIAMVYVALSFNGINLLETIQYTFRFYLPTLFNITASLTEASEQLHQILIDNEASANNNSMVILLSGFLAIILTKIVSTAGLPISLLMAYGFYANTIQKTCHPATLTYLFINIVLLFLFILIMHFLVSRYTLFLVIILCLFMPSIISEIYARNRAANNIKPVNFILGIAVTYCLISGLVSFGHSKQFIHHSITWVKDHANKSTLFYTNDSNIAYFTGRYESYYGLTDDIFLSAVNNQINLLKQTRIQGATQKEQTILIAIKYSLPHPTFRHLLSSYNFKLIKIFSNDRASQVEIYSLDSTAL